jgi:hypothetical protein
VTHLPTGLAAGKFAKKADAKKYAEMLEFEIEKRGIGEKARSDDPNTAGEALIDAAASVRQRMAEGGFVDAETVAQAARAAVEAVETGGSVVRRLWNKFQRSQIQAVEDAGMPEIAEIGRNATTATKRFQARLDTAGLMDLRRMKRSQLDSMQELVADEHGGYADRYARAMDAATARHFGEVE